MIFTDEDFEQEVLQSSLPVVVDFYADWCGPCKIMSPIIEEIEDEYENRVKVGKLNVDDNQEIAMRYRVMSIPTILLIKNGEIVDKVVGAVDKGFLEQKIESLLSL